MPDVRWLNDLSGIGKLDGCIGEVPAEASFSEAKDQPGAGIADERSRPSRSDASGDPNAISPRTILEFCAATGKPAAGDARTGQV